MQAPRSSLGKRSRFAFGNSSSNPSKRFKRSYPQRLPAIKSAHVTEKKVSDITEAVYQVNTTGSFTLLHVPTLGSDFNQRIGRKTLVKNFYIRGYVTLELARGIGSGGTSVSQQARLIMFIDNQPNGNAPAVTDLLNTASPTSHLNLNNRDRFVVLKDKTYEFDPVYNPAPAGTLVAALNKTIVGIKCFKKVNVEVIYNSTNGGTIADINSGALYMFWIGSVVTGTVDTNAVVSTRVRYLDA